MNWGASVKAPSTAGESPGDKEGHGRRDRKDEDEDRRLLGHRVPRPYNPDPHVDGRSDEPDGDEPPGGGGHSSDGRAGTKQATGKEEQAQQNQAAGNHLHRVRDGCPLVSWNGPVVEPGEFARRLHARVRRRRPGPTPLLWRASHDRARCAKVGSFRRIEPQQLSIQYPTGLNDDLDLARVTNVLRRVAAHYENVRSLAGL